jgi:hypothetical protein
MRLKVENRLTALVQSAEHRTGKVNYVVVPRQKLSLLLYYQGQLSQSVTVYRSRGVCTLVFPKS